MSVLSQEVVHSRCFILLGYWISQLAIKTVYDDTDGLVKSWYDVTFVKEAMYKFFNVSISLTNVHKLTAQFRVGLCFGAPYHIFKSG